MPCYVATVSAKWLKENTVIYSFNDVNDVVFSGEELQKASELDKQTEQSKDGSPLKQVRAIFSLFFMYSAPISFPIGYRTFKKDNLAYLKLSFAHPFSMRLSAYGEENQHFKTPLQLKRGDNNHFEQVGIEGQETVRLHLLTDENFSGDDVFVLTQGAFFNNQSQVDQFQDKFDNLRDYFSKPIFREYKIPICISETGQKKFRARKDELECMVKGYENQYQQIKKGLEELAGGSQAMPVSKLLALLDLIRIPDQEKIILLKSQSQEQIYDRIEDYYRDLGDIIDNYQDILCDIESYIFSDPTYLAPDNSPWQILVFPSGIGMPWIEQHFQQTLNYSHELIEHAEQEMTIPLVLSMPEPIYKTFLAEIQPGTKFKQIGLEVDKDQYIIQFPGNILASDIDKNLPKTKEAIKNYKPDQQPVSEKELPKDSFFSRIKVSSGRQNKELSSERTPLLNSCR
ncbi:hypothetical protein Lqui_2506 [Legionella quinlivanii]|uniref:Uncharacterized protein n=1 Tax=Legionella quinlivanii TaxID=45073 RepID=A0A0W0XPS1_9GAMM|nr:hypothetical protein [Legionella quinlivanii]KTD46581.1 hypothetical protein Lqui_2506 [Legionella quinlivanii]MCW8451525.1 hypothetical protein [Legionella quinlivanii]SEG08781.1 hypothetical protein SAMN02746093_01822 [Legionella quinlivanii DSM 21216]STY10270.1 Uncharacterised protein [Legionella quinlivanii]